MTNRTCLTCGDQFDAPPYKSGLPSARRWCPPCLSERFRRNARSSAQRPGRYNYTSDDRKVSKKDGYAFIRVNDIWHPEHRHVMEKMLGRPLIKGVESVHHINGVRDDNSEENLQLWLGGIRYGQRASDIKCHNCGESYKV